jgi:hypothetical protein
MKKFNMVELKPVSILMSMTTALYLDENGEAVDQREYRSMIDFLLYLTVTRPDIQFVVACVHAFKLPTLFTLASHSIDLQVSQIHTQI